MAKQSTAPEWVWKGRGANLRRQRKALGLSMEALSPDVGITAQQISKYERGESLVGAAWAARFATAFGCSILTIFRVPESLATEEGGVAEPRASFDHDDAGFEDVLTLARENLGGEARRVLAAFILELVDEEQTAPRPSWS